MILSRSRQLARAVFILVVTLFNVPALGAPQKLVVFGDRLSDPGNAFVLSGEQARAPYDLIPDAAYAIGGHHFSNGRTWVEHLAVELGTRSRAVFQNPTHNNYAIGRARAAGHTPFDFDGQVNLYLSQNAGADRKALHVVLIGGNDVRDALQALACDPSGLSRALILNDALNPIADNLGLLARAGARQFLIVNAPDLSLVTALIRQGATARGRSPSCRIDGGERLRIPVSPASRTPAV